MLVLIAYSLQILGIGSCRLKSEPDPEIIGLLECRRLIQKGQRWPDVRI